MTVPKIVLDTNLFVSLLLRSPHLASLGTLIANGKARLIVSPAQIGELTEVLHRPKFDFHPGEIKALLDWLKAEAVLVVPETKFPVICRDPKDNFLLAAATAGGADALVTGDKDLLTLGSYSGIPILSPSKFIASLA